ISELRFAGGGRVGLDRGHKSPSPTLPARTKDDIAGDERRTDCALVERVAVFPNNFPVLRVERIHAIALAGENRDRLAALRLVYTRRRIRHHSARPRRAPNRLSRLRVN